jgi:hypothetical protein
MDFVRSLGSSTRSVDYFDFVHSCVYFVISCEIENLAQIISNLGIKYERVNIEYRPK